MVTEVCDSGASNPVATDRATSESANQNLRSASMNHIASLTLAIWSMTPETCSRFTSMAVSV